MFIPKTVKPLVNLALFAKATVTKLLELSPTQPKTVEVVLLQVVLVVVVAVVAVESVLVEQLNAKKAVKMQPARILSGVLFFILAP
jgi:hypothetical protein